MVAGGILLVYNLQSLALITTLGGALSAPVTVVGVDAAGWGISYNKKTHEFKVVKFPEMGDPRGFQEHVEILTTAMNLVYATENVKGYEGVNEQAKKTVASSAAAVEAGAKALFK